MTRDLRRAAGGVEGGYARIVGRMVGEVRGEVGLLGTLQIRGLRVLHLGQEKIGSPVTQLDREDIVWMVRKWTYL
jgi:hypothetical protein